jgi:hypothetical protein
MRTVLIALSIITLLLGLWWVSKHSHYPEPAIEGARPNIVPVEVAPEGDANIVVIGSAPTAVASDPVREDAARMIERPDPARRHPYYEPEFGDALIDYLREAGLAVSDAERIANAAIDGLAECAVTSFSLDAEGRLRTSICDQNVLQETGLNEAIRRSALNDASRHLSRRLALERVAEVQR